MFIAKLSDGKIIKINPNDLDFLDKINIKHDKFEHKNIENIDGFVYCKDCDKIISISINKGE